MFFINSLQVDSLYIIIQLVYQYLIVLSKDSCYISYTIREYCLFLHFPHNIHIPIPVITFFRFIHSLSFIQI